MIEFSCPCGQAIAVGDDMGGTNARCPQCDQVLAIPLPPPEWEDTSADCKVCPYCGSTIKSKARKCPECREFIDPSAHPVEPSHTPAVHRNHRFTGPEYDAAKAGNASLAYAIIALLIPLAIPFFFRAISAGETAKSIAKTHQIPTPGSATAGVMIGYLSLLHLGWWIFYLGGVIILNML